MQCAFSDTRDAPQAEVTLSRPCPHVYAIFLRLHPTTTPHATSHDYNSGLNAIHVTSISQHALDLVSISVVRLHAGFLRLNRFYAKGLAKCAWQILHRRA